MKFIFLFVLVVQSLVFSQDKILNDTSAPMLCNINYQAKYEMEFLHGIEQRVQVQKQESFFEIIEPNKSFFRKKDGVVTCYNEFMKKVSYKAGEIRKIDKNSFDSYKRDHEVFDISSYANEDKDFVETKYNVSNQCKDYKDGEYCVVKNGLDVFYNKAGRVKKIFIYGSPLYGTNGNLPFEVDSFNKIRVNSEPLGLWVSEQNKKILKSKPTYETENVIIWDNPTKTIKRVVMSSKNGHKIINRYSNMKNEKLQDYLQAIEVEYVLDDKAYELHQQTRPMPEPSPYSNYQRLKVKKFPRKAITTWGKNLNPKNQIPKNKFKVFYINTNNPKKVIATQEMANVSVNYSWDKLHGIKSEDFGAYWVGNFEYENTKEMNINISQSWAKTRIIIDGMVIYEGGENKEIPFKFTKGNHKIEVEYVNNWHTTNFVVSIKEKEKVYTSENLKKELKKYTSKDSKVVYVGAYESSSRDNTINLKIAKQLKPVVLVLSSYDTVIWNIKNPHKVKIEAIVYSQTKPGVEVKGDIKSIPILAYKGRIGSYKMKNSCTCINGGAHFHCDGTNGIDTLNNIESLIGKKLFGYSVKYSTDTFIAPEVLLDAKKIKELQKEVLEVKKQRESCQNKRNPDFENIFK